MPLRIQNTKSACLRDVPRHLEERSVSKEAGLLRLTAGRFYRDFLALLCAFVTLRLDNEYLFKSKTITC
jgi:hypothetical protein